MGHNSEKCHITGKPTTSDTVKGASLLLEVGDMKLKVHVEGATIQAP